MLESLYLDNWKSFGGGDQASTVRFGRLTLLIGPNGSGKSNVLDALRFLQESASGRALDEVLGGSEGPGTDWPGIRGHAAEAARFGEAAFRLSSRWSDGSMHAMEVGTAPEVVLHSERVSRGEVSVIATSRPESESVARYSGELGKAFQLENEAGSIVQITQPSHSSVLLGLGDVFARPQLATSLRAIRQSLLSLSYLELRPSEMRDYRPTSSATLGASAENISPVLLRLSRNEPARFQNIVDWVDELIDLGPGTIDFEETALRDVMLFFLESSKTRISARSLSDGTLRFLGLVTALSTVPEGSVLLLEEPEVGLHSARVRLLAELFENIASSRNIQIVATTHSPTLLAHLSPEALGDVVAFTRSRGDGTTRCSRLSELKAFPKLSETNDVEHLISTGWVERAL